VLGQSGPPTVGGTYPAATPWDVSASLALKDLKPSLGHLIKETLDTLVIGVPYINAPRKVDHLLGYIAGMITDAFKASQCPYSL